MPKCKRCGYNIPDGKRICPACGADSTVTATRTVTKKPPAKPADPPAVNPMLKYFDVMDDRVLYTFGINSLNGIGIKKDYDAAFKAFTTLAKRGYPDGMYKLAELYEAMDPPDMDSAVMWLRIAAGGDNKHEPSRIKLRTLAAMGVIDKDTVAGLNVKDVPADGGATSAGTGAGGAPSAGTGAGGAAVYERAVRGVLELRFVTGGMASCSSGYLISEDGYAITNTHAVTTENGVPTKSLFATVCGEKVQADVIAIGDDRHGSGSGVDLALIKLRKVPESCIPLTFADYDTVRTGDTIYVIGNSLGNGTCITSGIISDKERMSGGSRCMMYDSATNGGNSGGPVLNTEGYVIATHVAGQRDNNGSKVQGMNYGIPEPDVLFFIEHCRCDVEITKVSTKAPKGESILL